MGNSWSSFPQCEPPFGVFDEGTAKDGFGDILYNKQCYDAGTNKYKLAAGLSTGEKTLAELVFKTAKKYPTQECAGYRKLIKIHQVEEKGKTFEKIELENTMTWITYSEYQQRITRFKKGIKAFTDCKVGDKLTIYAETQMDWMVSMFGAMCLGMPVVTIYATLGAEGASFGISQTKCKVVVADAKLAKTLASVAKDIPTVTHVILLGDVDESIISSLTSTGKKVIAMDDLLKKGAEANDFPDAPVKPDDCAVIMYTSGTTGPPKGVMISHGNLLALNEGTEVVVGWMKPGQTYLAYLPLAHIMELAAESKCLVNGLKVAYGNPHTLTDTGLKLKVPESVGDCKVAQPEFMVFAPAILDKIYNGLNAKMKDASSLVQSLYNMTLESGKRHFEDSSLDNQTMYLGANMFCNMLVAGKVQKMLGGKLSACASGSAPLSKDMQCFIQTMFNCPLRQGYGLTETCAAACVANWVDNSPNCVGAPTTPTCIRLADWPEGNYMNSDKDKPDVGMPRGEVLIGGNLVTMGYYVDESKTSLDEHEQELKKKNVEDYITIDGMRWFRSGDIGQITKFGTLQIIDRKKDLWKGPQGEYVALAKVESALKLNGFVDSCMVYGKTGGAFVVVLICANVSLLKSEAEAAGIKYTDLEELATNEEMKKIVASSCLKTCKENKLNAMEIPQKIALVIDPWTPENECLTAALKMKRPIIATRHKKEIDEMYA